jgi:tetratricopeptide (TPR) repeat protein
MMENMSMVLDNISEGIARLEQMRHEGTLLNESELAECYVMRGMLYLQMNRFAEAISDFDKSIGILGRMQSEGRLSNESGLAKAYAGRGMVHHIIGDCGRAIPDLSMSIDMFERQQSAGLPIEAGILFNMYIMRAGTLNTMYEHMDEAISDCNKSIIIAESLKKAGEPFDEDGLAGANMIIGVSCDQKEEFVEANLHYSKAIEIWERLRSEGVEILEIGNMVSAYMNRGSNYHQTNDNNNALKDYNKCISMIDLLQSEGEELDAFDVYMAYINRAHAHTADANMGAAINDIIVVMRTLKSAFSARPELQEIYYESLNETIEWVLEENDESLFNCILQEFLYPMCSVTKTEEAEEKQKTLLERIRNNFPANHPATSVIHETPRALYEMGTKYLFWEGVNEDRNKAMGFFIEAGKNGNGNAAFALGVMFFDMLEGPNASQQIANDAYTAWAMLVLDGHTQIYTGLQMLYPQYFEQLSKCIQVMTTKVTRDQKYEIDNEELARFIQKKFQQKLTDMFG